MFYHYLLTLKKYLCLFEDRNLGEDLITLYDFEALKIIQYKGKTAFQIIHFFLDMQQLCFLTQRKYTCVPDQRLISIFLVAYLANPLPAM